MWGKRQGSTSSSGGSRESKDGSEVPYSELLPLFRKRQLAHAHDEEQRRGSGHESGETLFWCPADTSHISVPAKSGAGYASPHTDLRT